MDALENIANAVLYEGYVLWPYRRSARKNQQRWTFGGVYPRGFVESARSGDRYRVQTECLVRGSSPRVDVELRFLQVVDRRLARVLDDGALEFVDELRTAEQQLLSWTEAVERRFPPGEIRVPADEKHEPVDGGTIVRSWAPLSGWVDVALAELAEDTRLWVTSHESRVTDDPNPARDSRLRDFATHRLRVALTNTSTWSGDDRDAAQRHGFMSAHFVLRVRDGSFVSLTDPPPELSGEAAACQQDGLWPVLVENEQTMLASPIILYDYPRVAPESPGMMFDSSEIDQLLILNTLALTDAEKAEVRATDPRAREILDRAESLAVDDLRRLHGTIRELSVDIDGTTVRSGSAVRLHPRAGGDIFDLALEGKTATVESIEQDFDDRVQLAVTVEDDPGRDLGMQRLPGHRFFFSPDEVEPIT